MKLLSKNFLLCHKKFCKCISYNILKNSILTIKTVNKQTLIPINLGINPTIRIWWQKHTLLNILSNHIINYPTPINLTYSWSFGFLSGLSLIVQLISGLFLAMFYTPHMDMTFASIDFIMREVNYGWFVRYIHSNGASMFFIAIYAHLFRSLFYGSYVKPRELLWLSGIILLLLLMAIAFLGYVLPWGQMSFWGATVITSMFTIIPIAGDRIVECLWGGFIVNNSTLNRFYVFHYLLPFIMCFFVLIHLTFLHKNGSNAPVTDSTGIDHIPFYPYFFIKDLFASMLFFLFFIFLIYFQPTYLSDPNNYITADPIRTPEHIVPEWYFLPFYGMLRSIPYKVTGVLGLVFSILILGILPLLTTSFLKDSSFRGIFISFYIIYVGNLIFLTWLGQTQGKDPHIFMGLYFSVVYFLNVVLIFPTTGIIELLLIFPPVLINASNMISFSKDDNKPGKNTMSTEMNIKALKFSINESI
jgi:ubiquinol-cytochrome c reductase cytochrome b subunit